MLELWQRRSLIILGDADNRILMLFGTESRQTGRFKAAEQASCFGKFSSQELLIKTSMLMMPSKMMLRSSWSNTYHSHMGYSAVLKRKGSLCILLPAMGVGKG